MGLNVSRVFEFRNGTNAGLEVAVYHHLSGHRGAQTQHSAGRASLSPGEAYCVDLQRSSRFGFNFSFGDHPFALVRLLDAAVKPEEGATPRGYLDLEGTGKHGQEILSGDPRITVNRVPGCHHVVFLLVTNVLTNSTWMGHVPPSASLGELNLPGAHDACARFGGPLAQCQSLTLAELLTSGVRVLDVRCRHVRDHFFIFHGEAYQYMNFEQVQNLCFEFLAKSTTETIVMMVNEEGKPEFNTRSFEDTFRFYIDPHKESWYLTNSIPRLENVRAKLVLLRRFAAVDVPLGLDATNWPDNEEFSVQFTSGPPPETLAVEDVYKPTRGSAEEKLALAIGWLEKARSDPERSEQNENEQLQKRSIDRSQTQRLKSLRHSLFLTYLSAAARVDPPLETPESYARRLNPAAAAYLRAHADRRYRWGTIMCDFPSDELLSVIIASNFLLPLS